MKNDIANQQLHSNVTPCGKCKLCPQINTAKLITNDKLNITEKIKNRPDNSELAKHFHENHNLSDDLYVTILENNIKTEAAQRYHEDKWICKLKTLAPNGLNTEIGDYAKEMYNFY